MQISPQEVARALQRLRDRRTLVSRPQPVRTIEDLAEKYGVDLEEVRRITEEVLAQEEDPARARRVEQIAARVEAGEYHVSGEQIVDMARRRALADRAAG